MVLITLISRNQGFRDEELVAPVEETLDNRANPFECNSDLVNITSGSVTSNEIAEDLKNAHKG